MDDQRTDNLLVLRNYRQVVILLCSALQETINTCGQCIVEGRKCHIILFTSVAITNTRL